MASSHIIGTGSYAPEKVVTNRDLEQRMNTTDAWITERTGIRERRLAARGEGTSDMGVRAATRALEMAQMRPEELDAIVVATITPDMPMPSCAALIQAKLGARRAFAFDVAAACAGSLFALSVADQYIRAGTAKRVLVVGTEMLTQWVDWDDRNTAILFGDAAGALVLTSSENDGRGIISTHLYTDGSTAEMLCIKGGGAIQPFSEEVLKSKSHKVTMNGREVFKFAVRALAESTSQALALHDIRPEEVNHVIAHQANSRILEAVLERLKIPREKCWFNLARYGNTSSASVPMTLDEANRSGKLKRGDLIAVMAIGAGMTWGSAIIRW